MYVIGFNGPPESGKDTAAEMLATHMDMVGVTMPVLKTSLSRPLRTLAYEMAGRDGKSLEGEDYERFKREWLFAPFKCTGRRLMIDICEKFLVPTYGPDVMVELFKRRYDHLLGQPAVLLIRDCGFQREVSPLIDWVGAENFYLVQVYRDGKTFDDDSREWVKHPNHRHMSLINNNGPVSDLVDRVDMIYDYLVDELGWKL